VLSERLKLILLYGPIITCLTLPYFLHDIIRKVAFFKKLDGIGHVVSLDHNLVSGTVAFYVMASPGNTRTNSFVGWFNNAMSIANVSNISVLFVGYFTPVSVVALYSIKW
jgi:hypothetical protein